MGLPLLTKLRHLKSPFFLFCRGAKGQSSLRDILQPLVKEILDDKNLNINTSPVDVYKQWINQMESETGKPR